MPLGTGRFACRSRRGRPREARETPDRNRPGSWKSQGHEARKTHSDIAPLQANINSPHRRSSPPGMPPLTPRRGDRARFTNSLHLKVLARRNTMEFYTQHAKRSLFNNRHADIRMRGGNPDTVWTTKTDTPSGSPHPPTTASSIVTTF